MIHKKKLIFISSQSVPTQIKLSSELQNYFDAKFWFYEGIGERPKWWKIPLGPNATVLKGVLFKKSKRYLAVTHLFHLAREKPDILMIGGFSIPANYLAYLWARNNGCKVVVFTERSRDRFGQLRSKNFWWIVIKFLYRKIDLLLVSAEDTVDQFVNTFGFDNEIVKASQYASDIDSYFGHELRNNSKSPVVLFANKLIPIYNPEGAIRIFSKVIENYPHLTMVMNAEGELRAQCEKLIIKLNLRKSVTFLERISSWDELHTIYRSSDIFFLPADFSNGNFSQLEAMASGMGIVISRNVLGLGNLIKHGINGFKCEHEEDAYIDAFREYLNNSVLLKTHGQVNKDLVKKFGISETAKLYYQQISQII